MFVLVRSLFTVCVLVCKCCGYIVSAATICVCVCDHKPTPTQGHTSCCAVLLTLPSHSRLILVILSFCSFGAHLFTLSHWLVLFTFSLSAAHVSQSQLEVTVWVSALKDVLFWCFYFVLFILFCLFFFYCMENGPLSFCTVEEPVLSYISNSLSPLWPTELYLQQQSPVCIVNKITSAPATHFLTMLSSLSLSLSPPSLCLAVKQTSGYILSVSPFLCPGLPGRRYFNQTHVDLLTGD